VPRIVFPDNSVLCNFAAAEAPEVLLNFLRGDGRWTQAIYAEARKSVRYLPSLAAIVDSSALGEPIEITDVERVERIRRAVFGGTAREPKKHLGEAETCFLIDNDEAFAQSTWLTDDRDAYDFARQRGIHTLDTFEVLLMVVADGDLTPAEAHDLQRKMLDADRTPLRTAQYPEGFR